MTDTPVQDSLRAAFSAIVGPAEVLGAGDDLVPYLTEPRHLFHGKARLVVRPGTPQEAAAVMALAAETRTPVVPQGGVTGLVGGSVPDTTGTEIVVSTKRLNRIRAVDPHGNTLIAEAGVTLAEVQDAAASVDRFFPLSLGAEGTCTIGGNLGTNAGGTAVLAYGNMRDLALGLEVALADGSLWNGLRLLRKDNTGYDLKHLFIGSEGTLGLITAASLKMFARPRDTQTALVAMATPAAALAVFSTVRAKLGSSLTTAELMPRIGIQMDIDHLPGTRDPFTTPYDWYLLLEATSPNEGGIGDGLESALADTFESGAAIDAVLAQSEGERQALWHLRHGIPETQGREGGSIKHDVSVPVADVPAFIEAAMAAVVQAMPGCRPVPFGHIGDGNIHFNVTQPVGADTEAYLARWDEMNAVVHGVVASFHGSIAAEHGVGRLKRGLLPGVKDPVELALMHRVKAALDPYNILNPGVVL